MAKQIEGLIKDFLNKCLHDGRRAFTIKGHKSRLKKLRAYLEENDLFVYEVGIYEAQGFKGFLIELMTKENRKYSNNYIVKIIQSARQFYQYLLKKKKVQANPFAELVNIREEKSLPAHVLKEKETALLLDELTCFTEGKTVRDVRNIYRAHVIAELQYATGMRIREVAHLKEHDIDWEKGIITVSAAKGGKQRIAFLTDYAKQVLHIYITRMRDIVLTDTCNRKSLFGGTGGKFLTLVNRELKKASGKLGFGPVTNREFRHAFGYHFLRAGCDLRYIQQLLGHDCIRSTEVYTKVDKEDLKEILDTYHPRRKAWKNR